jgi:hypothetical protein
MGQMYSFAYLAGGEIDASGVWSWKSIGIDTSSNVINMIKNICPNTSEGQTEYNNFLNNLVENPRVTMVANDASRALDLGDTGLKYTSAGAESFTELTTPVSQDGYGMTITPTTPAST